MYMVSWLYTMKELCRCYGVVVVTVGGGTWWLCVHDIVAVWCDVGGYT